MIYGHNDKISESKIGNYWLWIFRHPIVPLPSKKKKKKMAFTACNFIVQELFEGGVQGLEYTKFPLFAAIIENNHSF